MQQGPQLYDVPGGHNFQIFKPNGHKLQGGTQSQTLLPDQSLSTNNPDTMDNNNQMKPQDSLNDDQQITYTNYHQKLDAHNIFGINSENSSSTTEETFVPQTAINIVTESINNDLKNGDHEDHFYDYKDYPNYYNAEEVK